MKKYIVLACVGLLSGVLNFLLILNEIIYAAVAICFAGTVYGIVTGVYFINNLHLRKKFVRLFLWVIASSISYYLSVLSFSLSMNSRMINDGYSYGLAGFIGSLIVVVAFNYIFQNLKIKIVLTILIAGILLPYILFTLFYQILVTLFHFMNVNLPLNDVGFVGTLYIVWQTVISLMLDSSFLSQKLKVL